MSTTATRKLAAILFVDIVDFSRRMNEDEHAGLEFRRHVELTVKGSAINHSGRVVKDTGDGAMVAFSSAVGAVSCALEIRDQIALYNDAARPSTPFRVRMGIHVGDVAEEGDDLYGNAVNIAQRVQTMAPPGGICITREVYAQIRPIMKVQCKRVGSRPEKRLPEQVEVLSLVDQSSDERGAYRTSQRRFRPATVIAASAAFLALLAVGGFMARKSNAENSARRNRESIQAASERAAAAEMRVQTQASHDRFRRELDNIVKLVRGEVSPQLAYTSAFRVDAYRPGAASETAYQMIAALSAREQAALLTDKYLLWTYRDLPAEWKNRWSEFWMRAQKHVKDGTRGTIDSPLPSGWSAGKAPPSFGAESTSPKRAEPSLSDARVGLVVLDGFTNVTQELWCWILFPTEKRGWLVAESRDPSHYTQENAEYWQQWETLALKPDSPLPSDPKRAVHGAP